MKKERNACLIDLIQKWLKQDHMERFVCREKGRIICDRKKVKKTKKTKQKKKDSAYKRDVESMRSVSIMYNALLHCVTQSNTTHHIPWLASRDRDSRAALPHPTSSSRPCWANRSILRLGHEINREKPTWDD